MRITVVIAGHEAATLLPLSLASVAAQTGVDWDLVVVEYGARDSTASTIAGFGDSRHPAHYEYLATAEGPATARNRCVELAAGTAVAFLEPGDAWLPRHLALAVQQLHAGADVVISNACVNGATAATPFREIAVPPQLVTTPARTLFTQDVIPWVSCIVVRRTALQRVDGFDPRFHGGETRDLWFRCALKGARFAATQSATCKCRALPASAVHVLQAAQETSRFYEKHRDLPQLPAALRRRLLANSLVNEGRLLRPVDAAQAARCFWRAWSLQPVQVQTLGQFALTGFARPPDPGSPR